jgi:hypothetical protein
VGLSGLNLRVLVPYLPALGWGALRTVEISALWHRSCRRRYLCCLGLSTIKEHSQIAIVLPLPALCFSHRLTLS